MGVIATDNFNRANENPLSDGGSWTGSALGLGAHLEVVTNQLTVPSGIGNDSGFYWNANVWPNDHYSKYTIVTVSNAVNAEDGNGLAVRVSAAAATGYVVATGSGGAGTQMSKYVSGTFTDIASGAAFANGDVMQLQAVGTTITCLKNGVSNCSVTDNSISAGNAGLYYSSESGVSAFIADNWEGGNFSGGSPLRRNSAMNGLGASGPFFRDPLAGI